MDFTSQEYVNYGYRRLVPERYQKQSGLSCHDFRVREPSSHPYQFAQLANGDIRQFEVSAFCTIMHSGKLTPMLVRQSVTPAEYEAVLLIGKLLFGSNLAQKYITLHKAYECIESNRDVTLSAVRHALAHAESSLTRPKTRNALIGLFGSTNIDFCNRRHVRLFYGQFGTLLIETDKLLFERLTQILPKTASVPSDVKLLHDWQVVSSTP